MKISKKYVVISLVMSIMLLVGLVSNVSATSGSLLTGTGNGNSGLVLTPDASPTPDPSATTSVTPTPSPTPTPTPRPTTTVRPTNDINSNVSKDLPQTGENDIYIVSAIGAVALIIGGVAYMKSRKYDM